MDFDELRESGESRESRESRAAARGAGTQLYAATRYITESERASPEPD